MDDLLVGELHGDEAALAHEAALQHRVQHGVQLLIDVLDQQWTPRRQALLQSVCSESSPHHT